MPREPRAARPHMPNYGLLPADRGRGLLPWSWAEERLRASRNFWVSTVAESGAPHAMPVWCVWEEGALWFSTDGASRKARNLARDPRCVVTTEGAAEAVIVEGEAELASAAPVLARVALVYEAKYGMGYPPDSHVYAVRPRVAFGFVESAAQFAGAATRWTWE